MTERKKTLGEILNGGQGAVPIVVFAMGRPFEVDPQAIQAAEERHITDCAGCHDDCLICQPDQEKPEPLAPEQKKPDNESTREQIIHAMCLTRRHDYGIVIDDLQRKIGHPVGSGMTKGERQRLFDEMAQLYDNCIGPRLFELELNALHAEEIARLERLQDQRKQTTEAYREMHAAIRQAAKDVGLATINGPHAHGTVTGLPARMAQEILALRSALDRQTIPVNHQIVPDKELDRLHAIERGHQQDKTLARLAAAENHSLSESMGLIMAALQRSGLEQLPGTPMHAVVSELVSLYLEQQHILREIANQIGLPLWPDGTLPTLEEFTNRIDPDQAQYEASDRHAAAYQLVAEYDDTGSGDISVAIRELLKRKDEWQQAAQLKSQTIITLKDTIRTVRTIILRWAPHGHDCMRRSDAAMQKHAPSDEHPVNCHCWKHDALAAMEHIPTTVAVQVKTD